MSNPRTRSRAHAHLNAELTKSILNINCENVPMNSICQTKVVIVSKTLTEARSEQRPVSYDILAFSQIACPSQLRSEIFQLPSPTVQLVFIGKPSRLATGMIRNLSKVSERSQERFVALSDICHVRFATRTICKMSSPTEMSTSEYAGHHSLFEFDIIKKQVEQE